LLGAKRSSSGGVCEAGHVVDGDGGGKEKGEYGAVWTEAERRVGLKAL
jgi:hypothetical protein